MRVCVSLYVFLSLSVCLSVCLCIFTITRDVLDNYSLRALFSPNHFNYTPQPDPETSTIESSMTWIGMTRCRNGHSKFSKMWVRSLIGRSVINIQALSLSLYILVLVFIHSCPLPLPMGLWCLLLCVAVRRFCMMDTVSTKVQSLIRSLQSLFHANIVTIRRRNHTWRRRAHSSTRRHEESEYTG